MHETASVPKALSLFYELSQSALRFQWRFSLADSLPLYYTWAESTIYVHAPHINALPVYCGHGNPLFLETNPQVLTEACRTESFFYIWRSTRWCLYSQNVWLNFCNCFIKKLLCSALGSSDKEVYSFREGSVIVCGYFIPKARWKYCLFIQFFHWWNLELRYFAGYSFGTSRKKASTIF